MKSAIFLTTICATVSLLTTSCATIAHGTSQSIAFESQPSNARVYVDRKYVGNTPVKTQLARKQNHTVSFELDGFEPCEIALENEFSGWVLGNIISWNMFGVAVDAVSGAIYKFPTDQVSAQLQPKLMRTEDGTCIQVFQGSDPSWEQIGQLKKRPA